MNKGQKAIDDWFNEQSWPYWQPHEMLARTIEETGEFARLVNHVYGPKQKKSDEETQNFKDEIGDILYSLACFCNEHNIDMDEALLMSHEKVVRRDAGRF